MKDLTEIQQRALDSVEKLMKSDPDITERAAIEKLALMVKSLITRWL